MTEHEDATPAAPEPAEPVTGAAEGIVEHAAEQSSPDQTAAPAAAEAAEPTVEAVATETVAPEPATTAPSATTASDPAAPAQSDAARAVAESQSSPQVVYVQQPPQKQHRMWPVVVGALAAGAVFGAATGAGTALLVARGAESGGGTVQAGPQTITVNDQDDVNVITAVAAQAIDSVVTISVSGSSGAGSGSGVVLDDEGHIVTNNHVVTLGGTVSDATIKVTTSAGRVYTATVVGTDPLMDLAVIQVKDAPELVPIEFADSDRLNVGDTTIAIGAPLGLAGTVTSGIISSLDRSIQVASSAVPEEGSSPSPEQTPDPNDPFDFFNFELPGVQASTPKSLIPLVVIQTDTAINPGNSGGALLDTDGRLIGVNVAIATSGSGSSSAGSIGVGFAIPANVVERVTAELIETGQATHGMLGVTVVNAADANTDGQPGVVGAEVSEVIAGGAAEQAGLETGDVIVAFGGEPITSTVDLTAQVRTHAAGATVEVGYLHDGASKTATVVLGALES